MPNGVPFSTLGVRQTVDGVIQTAPPATAPTDGLMAHYTMDDADVSSGTLVDATGNGYDATISGPTTGLNGGEAFSFDGVDDYLATSAPALLDLGTNDTFTISAWINVDSTSDTGGSILDSRDRSGTWQGISVVCDPVGQEVTLVMDDTNVNRLISDPVLIIDNPVHIVVVYDGATATIYQDASVIGSASISAGAIDGRSVDIGRFRDAGKHFMGTMEDVRFYNRALSESEVTDLHSALT